MPTEAAPRTTIRLLEPADVSMVADFHRKLSNRTLRYRYLQPLSPAEPDKILMFVNEYFPIRPDSTTFVAAPESHELSDPRPIVGLARLTSSLDGEKSAEFGLVVADDWQRQGVGGRLMSRLIAEARLHGCSKLVGDVLRDNFLMQRFCKRRGFAAEARVDHAVIRMVLTLDGPS